MKTSITLFALMGIFLIAALVIGYIYIPNLDKVNGTRSIEGLEIELPISSRDLRNIEEGVQPFCKEDIQFEVKENSEILSPGYAYVSKIDGNTIYLEPQYGVEISISPVTDISVLEGTYVIAGDSIGSLESGSSYVSLSIRDVNDDVYLCPFDYLSLSDASFVSSMYSVDFCSCK